MVLQLDTFFYVTFVNVVKLFQWGQPFPHDCRAPWSIFSPMFGLSSSISWIKLSSSLSLIPVYLSVISNSCLFVRNVRSDAHKISAIFFHVNAKSLKSSSSSLVFHTLVFPVCTCLSYQSIVITFKFIYLVTKITKV